MAVVVGQKCMYTCQFHRKLATKHTPNDSNIRTLEDVSESHDNARVAFLTTWLFFQFACSLHCSFSFKCWCNISSMMSKCIWPAFHRFVSFDQHCMQHFAQTSSPFQWQKLKQRILATQIQFKWNLLTSSTGYRLCKLKFGDLNNLADAQILFATLLILVVHFPSRNRSKRRTRFCHFSHIHFGISNLKIGLGFSSIPMKYSVC